MNWRTPAVQRLKTQIFKAVTGNCGTSVVEVGKYLAEMETRGISINLATLIGQGSVRREVMKEEDLPGQAAAKGAYLMEKLKKIESRNIREVRGLGLMVGIEMKQKVAPYIKALQEKRIIALNAGMTVIRLLPPLVISYQQIDHLVDVLTEVLAAELVSVDA